MTLIIFAVIIGMALGAILKGALKIAVVVVLAVAAVGFTCHEMHIDWHNLLNVAADQATEQYEHVQPSRRVRQTRSWL